MIYHICTREEWNAQRVQTFYHHKTLTTEGFIHCSTKDQISGVLERYFSGVKNLVCLSIDPLILDEKLVFERSTNDELFPHVYGPIPKEAIVKIEPI